MHGSAQGRRSWFQFGVRQLLLATTWFAIALAGYQGLESMPAGSGSAFAVILCFLAMPVGVCSSVGALFGKGSIGAIVGLLIGLPLAGFFWEVWQAANC
jgi:hypothetical protein